MEFKKTMLIIILIILALLIIVCVKKMNHIEQEPQYDCDYEKCPAEMVNGMTCEETSIPFLINGEDTGYTVEIDLGSYYPKNEPEFGMDKEIHYTVEEDIITIYFHPKTKYRSPQGKSFNDKYWLYVGLSADKYGNCGGYNGNVDIENKQINFKGEFRLIDENIWEQKSITIGGLIFYYDKGRTNERVLAYNDVGWIKKPLNEASITGDLGGWWHNMHWGTWWDKDNIGEWQSFNVDLTAADEIARTKSNLLPADSLLKGFYIGPEFETGRSLVFQVKNLEATISS